MGYFVDWTGQKLRLPPALKGREMGSRVDISLIIP